MKGKKQDIEAVVMLDKSNCYYLNNGVCSLDVVSDYYINPSEKIAPNDLLYCPKVYKALTSREKMKPITLTVCKCGHADVTGGAPVACVASQKKLPVTAEQDKEEAAHDLCAVCGGQQMMEFSDERGKRLMPLSVIPIRTQE